MNTSYKTAATTDQLDDTPPVPLVPVTKRGRRLARSPGHGPWLPPMQKLTNERFMSRTQREAYRTGQEIWV